MTATAYLSEARMQIYTAKTLLGKAHIEAVSGLAVFQILQAATNSVKSLLSKVSVSFSEEEDLYYLNEKIKIDNPYAIKLALSVYNYVLKWHKTDVDTKTVLLLFSDSVNALDDAYKLLEYVASL